MGFESSVAYGVKTLIVESSKVPRTLVRVRVRVRVRVSVRVRVRVQGAPHHSDLLQPRGVELGAWLGSGLGLGLG